MIILFFLQLNTSALLQNIGLVIIQAVFTAPIYGLAMYWGILLAFRTLGKASNSTTTKTMNGDN